MNIRPARESDRASWLEMQLTLWPDEDFDVEEWAAHQEKLLERGHAFLAFDGEIPVGFAEVGLRPYAEGCKSSPVAFLEGWFVKEHARGRGIGRALVQRVEQWALEVGCTELASDALLENVDSHRAHGRLGFEEVERLVAFRKSLERGSTPL